MFNLTAEKLTDVSFNVMWIYIGHSPLQPPVPGDDRGKAPYVSAEKVLLFNIYIEKLFIKFESYW